LALCRSDVVGLWTGAKPIEQRGHLGGARPIALRRSGFRGILFVLGACVLAAACVHAQQAAPQTARLADPVMGSVHGTVESADGTVYEGARVLLSRPGEPAAAEQTDSSGAFDFDKLSPGAFKLTVSSSGFQTQSVSGDLQAGEAWDARTIVLSMTSAANSVEVSGGSQVEIAEAQLNLEEQQRILGFLPNYYVSYDPDALPLTTHQKFELAWRTSIDPVTFLMTGTVAGIEQSNHTFKGYGEGIQGYAKRFGANYVDGFDADMIGGAILPSLFRQDPRYFVKGTGSIHSRVLHAISSAVMCRGDNGHWQFDYSGILGGIAAGGISNLYYPAGDRSGIQVTFENAAIGTAESAAANLIQEFVIRRLTPHLPAYSSAGAR
jgi:hypothetical protein